mmetsp:Transcript_10190/g.31786  ORF Transcript_10190/g.31786 Transcript_10190/m.31786 type:complete len:273 (+) Transcript_10190:46-864(+)
MAVPQLPLLSRGLHPCKDVCGGRNNPTEAELSALQATRRDVQIVIAGSCCRGGGALLWWSVRENVRRIGNASREGAGQQVARLARRRARRHVHEVGLERHTGRLSALAVGLHAVPPILEHVRVPQQSLDMPLGTCGHVVVHTGLCERRQRVAQPRGSLQVEVISHEVQSGNATVRNHAGKAAGVLHTFLGQGMQKRQREQVSLSFVRPCIDHAAVGLAPIDGERCTAGLKLLENVVGQLRIHTCRALKGRIVDDAAACVQRNCSRDVSGRRH